MEIFHDYLSVIFKFRFIQKKNIWIGSKYRFDIQKIWRILSSHSLWVSWIKMYLIRKGSFWTVRENSLSDSWMWRKILKCRETEKWFYRVEIRNGRKTSFWQERWSVLGCLKEVLSNGAHIDMGIMLDANMEACRSHRRKHHRIPIFNRVETK